MFCLHPDLIASSREGLDVSDNFMERTSDVWSNHHQNVSVKLKAGDNSTGMEINTELTDLKDIREEMKNFYQEILGGGYYTE